MKPDIAHRQGASISSAKTLVVGLISDTHGLLRPEAVEALRGSDFIVHAGDIGAAEILDELTLLAPVTAIRGNSDGNWAWHLPDFAVLQVGEVRLFIIHSAADADSDYANAGYDAVISGHTHLPESAHEDGVLFVNPGSAGPYRPNTPVAVGRLHIQGKTITTQSIELDAI